MTIQLQGNDQSRQHQQNQKDRTDQQMFVLQELLLQLSPISFVLRSLSRRADDDEHRGEDVEEKGSEELNEENQSVGELNERRVTNDAPGALFAQIVVEMQVREMRNEDQHVEENEKNDHVLRQALAAALAESDSSKDRPGAFDRHASVEPMVEIDQQFQQRFDDEAIAADDPTLTDEVQRGEKKKEELHREDEHREQRTDRRGEKIHSAARLLTDRMAEGQDRTDPVEQTNGEHR